MQHIDLKNIKHVHFIGIGGIGISAVARMMMIEGKKVTGNDLDEFEMVQALRSFGVNTVIGKDPSSIPAGVDLIVYSIAWTTLGPELLEYALTLGIPVVSYPEMLHIVTEGKYTIAVAGTHGKTTTAAMITQILRDAQKDPSVIIGSLLVNEKSNFIAGKSEYFIVEACEYRRSFLNINPTILVITNIDEDHLDYYKDIEDIKSAFRELALKVPAQGFIVCSKTDPHIKDVIEGVSAKVIDYDANFNPHLSLKIPGIHNKRNAAAAYGVGKILSIPPSEIEKSLGAFKGTWRRFEYKGMLSSGALIYDDYAHHPVEIVATLQGFRELYPKDEGWKITVLFQPHLFSRTKALLSEFAESFKDADKVLILPIYQAREEDDGTISAKILADKIVNSQSLSFNNFEEAQSYIKAQTYSSKDIIITMGAGEAFKIGDSLLEV